MPFPFLTDLDFGGLAGLINPVLVQLGLQTSDPSSPSEADIWADGQVYGLKFQSAGKTKEVFSDFFNSGAMAWKPNASAATVTGIGIATTQFTGTATTAAIATTNKYTMMARLEALVTVAATTAVAGFRAGTNLVTIGGNATGDGGFRFSITWGPATGVATATARAWAGLKSGTGVPTDVEPSSELNSIGMGWDAADTNIQMMFNDASGTAAKVDLGASFPVPTVDRTSVYRLEMYSPPGTVQSVQWRVTDLVSGAVAQGTQTTKLSTTSTLMCPRVWASVGGTSSVIGVALMSMFLDPLL